MRKIFATISLILFAGCSTFTSYSPVEYNNKIVNQINTSSVILETSATMYNDTIPDVVTEKDTVSTEAMLLAYNDAVSTVEDVNELLKIKSKDKDQEANVRAELEIYIIAIEAYLQSYKDTLAYYETEAYKDDVSLVEMFDQNLHSNYTTFIEANNDLVETLESFVVEEETE